MTRTTISLAVLSLMLTGAAVAAPAKATSPAPANQVLVGTQRITVPPGSDPALVATQAWAKTGHGQIIMDDDKPLYPYGLMVPTLVCSPGFACTINLQAGETPQAVVFGNPGAWQAEPMAAADRYIVAIRALEYQGESNVLITTDKRAYNIKLKADREHYVPVIGFYYPKEQMASWVNQAQQAKQAVAQKTQAQDNELPSLTAADLNFRYYMEGRDYSWKPVRVYDDGKKTFIEMNPQMQVSSAPALVVISKDGQEEPVNYRVKGNYYVLDRLVERAALLNGVGRGAERIDIFKGDQPKKLFGLF